MTLMTRIGAVPRLYLALGALVVVGLLVGGAYFKGHGDGAAEVRGEWNAEKVVAGAAYQVAVQERDRITRERDDALKEIADDLKPKLEAATDSVDGLARRLRLATARPRDCPVPGDSTVAAGDTGGDPMEEGVAAIERDAQALWEAGAAADALYDTLYDAYERVRTAGD